MSLNLVPLLGFTVRVWEKIALRDDERLRVGRPFKDASFTA